MLIYIVRHGETNLNVRGVVQGWLDEPLNENGRFLAAVTGQNMKGIHFDACISSPFVRAAETAEIILRESGNPVEIETDLRLREIHFGTLEGNRLPKEEAVRFFRNPFACGTFPEGESAEDVCRRTQAFLYELAERDDGKTYLVSTHGFALRAMLNRIYAEPGNFWHGRVPYNCAINIVEAHGGKMKLIADDRIYYDPKYCVDRYAFAKKR